jgi:TPR repeat protein
MRRCFVGVTAAALLASGCDRRGDAHPTPEQAPPVASVISLGVEMGGYPDLIACADECDAGSADRCRRMAVSYEFGKGVERHLVRATELYEKSCAMRDWEGCVAACRMYEFHHGVSKDDTKAVSFYERACDGRSAVGFANLAIMLESGHGVAQDPGTSAPALRPSVRERLRSRVRARQGASRVGGGWDGRVTAASRQEIVTSLEIGTTGSHAWHEITPSRRS